ncbi:carbohydrate kinase family protein [Candidatus Woesearchaeota archaeon]|nr:carbohydrate kinase family protein [Candidatus Woesearchaeota archaeon]
MYDIITVGSATVDVFVHTATDATKITSVKREHDVCYPIGGKILIDKLTFDTGGAGTNTAVAFSQLGLKTGWIGKLGDDANSKHILDALNQERVKFLGSHGKGNTGYSVIIVGLLNDRTILTHKGINDALAVHDVAFQKVHTRWFYFGSMMGTSFHTLCMLAALAKRTHVPYAFNPSTYLAKQGYKILSPIIDGCEVLILNKEEAQLLTHTTHVAKMLESLQRHANTVVITDGKNGAFAFDGHERLRLFTRAVRVVETTGAGDAFASGVVYAISRGKPLSDAMKTGLAEAESVLQHIGAKKNLLKKSELHKNIKHIRVEAF